MKDDIAFAVYKAETSVKNQTTSPDNLEIEQAITLIDKIRKFPTINVELKNPIESAVALNKESVVIRGVDCRTLGALGMPLPRLRYVHYREKYDFEMYMAKL